MGQGGMGWRLWESGSASVKVVFVAPRRDSCTPKWWSNVVMYE